MLLRRISVFTVLLLSIGGTFAIVNANPLFSQRVAQNPDRPQNVERGKFKFMEELNLTANQKQRLEAIRNQNKDKMKERMQALRQAKQEFQTLMAGTASTDQIRQKHRQVEALHQELGEMRFESMLASREILTPEQRRKFAELMQQRRGHSKNRNGNRRDSSGPGPQSFGF